MLPTSSNPLVPLSNDIAARLHTLILGEPKTSFTPADIAQRLSINLPQAQEALDYLAAFEREYETNAKLRGIAKVFLRGQTFYEALSDNPDIRRDYDFRATNEGGRDFCPKNMFYYVWAWINIAEERFKKHHLDNNKRLLITHDCRYYQPEIIEAAKKAALLRGYKVKFAYAEGTNPSCVSSYSHAARLVCPSISIFITASHVSRPAECTVIGAKVYIFGTSGKLENLSTKDIKITTAAVLQNLKVDGDLGRYLEPTNDYKEFDVAESFARLCTVGSLSGLGKIPGSLYDLAQKLKVTAEIDTLLKNLLPEEIPQAFEGLKIVIEGAHTSSGPLAERVFKTLGAQTFLLNGDVQEIKGTHKADPSITDNLGGLFEEILKQQAHLGIAFDLDGDRGAIILPDGRGGCYVPSPDKIGQTLIPFLINEGGYRQASKPMYVRDCLATDALISQAEISGVHLETTDAGYVYLKKREIERASQGFLAIGMQEASGHAWLDFAGAFENPILMAILFTAMALRKLSEDGNLSENLAEKLRQDYLAVHKQFESVLIPYRKSTRFQPLFAQSLLKQVAQEAKAEWTPESGQPVPQRLIGLCRSACVQKLMKYFVEGRIFQTPVGALAVEKFESYWDEDEKIHRFGKIYFSLKGEVVASFVARGSSNDPTAVAVWEAKEFAGSSYTGERLDEEVIQKRFDTVGGLVLTACEELGVLELVDRKPAVNMAEVMKSVARYRAAKA